MFYVLREISPLLNHRHRQQICSWHQSQVDRAQHGSFTYEGRDMLGQKKRVTRIIASCKVVSAVSFHGLTRPSFMLSIALSILRTSLAQGLHLSSLNNPIGDCAFVKPDFICFVKAFTAALVCDAGEGKDVCNTMLRFVQDMKEGNMINNSGSHAG